MQKAEVVISKTFDLQQCQVSSVTGRDSDHTHWQEWEKLPVVKNCRKFSGKLFFLSCIHLILLSVSKAAEERGWRLQAATLHYKHSLFLPCPYFHFGLLGLWEDVLTTWAWIGELVGLRHREDERAMESDGLICGSPTRIDWLFCQQWFL